MNELLYWVWYAFAMGQSRRAVPLMERFGSPKVLYDMSSEELMTLGREFGASTVERLVPKNLDKAYLMTEYCEKNAIKILCYGQEYYPNPLTKLKNPPIILYARGSVEKLAGRLSIGVVGTRQMTDYGRDTAYRMGYELASAGAVVVSGLARGIDSAAACGALDAGGFTVAVLGNGVSYVYPAEHEKLSAEIAERGVLLSEYPPEARPAQGSFPARNRIISGLSQGTVVIEAPMKSGALITARDAILQGKDVFALPGNVDRESAAGANALIRAGATAVTCAADILENYSYLYRDVLDPSATRRVAACSGFVPGKLAAHGVFEQSVGGGRVKRKDDERPLAKHLDQKKRLDGEELRALGGESEYPLYEEIKMESTGVLPKLADDGVRAKPISDRSAPQLASLPESCRAVFEAMPIGEAISADGMCRFGFEISQIMVAFTMLEMRGLIVRLPGGLYGRR